MAAPRSKQPAPTPHSSILAALQRRAGELAAGHDAGAHVVRPAAAPPTPIDINQELARERKLRNDNTEQDIALKRSTLQRLFLFLAVETAFIFLFALCQAIHWPAQFQLQDWSFNLLVTATILQITGMLFVAVRYLFPTGKSGGNS